VIRRLSISLPSSAMTRLQYAALKISVEP